MVSLSPLSNNVKKIDTGIYKYRGLFLRFNKMEGYFNKWSAHYKLGDSHHVARSVTIRGLISMVDEIYQKLSDACGVK